MKKRFEQFLLCGLLVCSLVIPKGYADEKNIDDPIPETQNPATLESITPLPVTPVPATPVPVTPEPEIPAPITEEPTVEPTQDATAIPTQQPAVEATQEPTSEPTLDATSTPTEDPTSEPTQDATSAPTEEPTSDPTQEPTSEPTQEPTSEPTQEPTQEPTSDPTPEPTPKPTLEPSYEPSMEPTVSPSVSPMPSATPLPQPGSIDGLVNIAPVGTAHQENGIWKIQLSTPSTPVPFNWSVNGDASSYYVYVQSGQNEIRFVAETSGAHIDLSSQNYENGQHILYVGAVFADGSVTWGKAAFELMSQQEGPPNGGFPGGFPGGGKPGGGMPNGSGSMGELPQGEQGFRVTPGKALTSKHASGTKNTTIYTHSEIADSAETITSLFLSSTQTEITLDDGAFFFIAEEDGKLQLTPESEGKCWYLSVLAMNTLFESGIDRVVFQVGNTSCSLLTQMEFSGSTYASLRAKGYVSKDMVVCVNMNGVRIHVADCIYSINENGELVPCEE